MLSAEEKCTLKECIGATRAVCLVLAVLVSCYLLYTDAMLPCSINTVWERVNHFVRIPHFHFQVVTVGLLPVYVALMVFGAAFLGAFAGECVIQALSRWRRSMQ